MDWNSCLSPFSEMDFCAEAMFMNGGVIDIHNTHMKPVLRVFNKVTFQTSPQALPAFCTRSIEWPSQGWSGQGVALTTHPLLEPRLSMGWATLLHPLSACLACYGQLFNKVKIRKVAQVKSLCMPCRHAQEVVV